MEATKIHAGQENMIIYPLPLLEQDFDESYDEIQADIFSSAWSE